MNFCMCVKKFFFLGERYLWLRLTSVFFFISIFIPIRVYIFYNFTTLQVESGYFVIKHVFIHIRHLLSISCIQKSSEDTRGFCLWNHPGLYRIRSKLFDRARSFKPLASLLVIHLTPKIQPYMKLLFKHFISFHGFEICTLEFHISRMTFFSVGNIPSPDIHMAP